MRDTRDTSPIDTLTSFRTLTSQRQWAAIPEPYQDLASLYQAVAALKSRSLVQSRETKNISDSFVTVQDLVDLGIIDARGKKV